MWQGWEIRARWSNPLPGAHCVLPPSGGSRDRTRSPPIVSAKREYSRIWPKTFGNSSPQIIELGVWRRNQMHGNPLFPASSRIP
jgi:hypothetical protein